MAKIWRRQQGQEIANIKRGEIYLVSFDPTVGHEIKKTRPALSSKNAGLNSKSDAAAWHVPFHSNFS